MKKFEEPIMELYIFKTEDSPITTSYKTNGSDDNSYINEDNYNQETGPWM